MNTLNKPYSESCVQNGESILSIIKQVLVDSRALLEIGSGTGQHAVAFAAQLPHLTWHTSDRSENLAGIRLWLDEARLENVQAPLLLDVAQAVWPEIEVDGIFTANTAHIMHWSDVEVMFEGAKRLLPSGGHFLIYGPFNYGQQYTSDSNARFDQWLKVRDLLSGIRNFEDVDRLAKNAGMTLINDYAMPANNHILHWQKN